MDQPLQHPVLAPGVRVLRRDTDEVQVGLDPSRALRLRTTPAVRRTLRVVTQSVAGDADPDLLHALHERGLVTEHSAGAQPDPHPVALVGDCPDDLLVGAGLRIAGPDDRATVALLVAAGEPDRSLLDPWVVAGLPHLVVRFVDGDAVVGPFVVPGVTPCLRCLDGHHTDDDPRWPLLVAQQGSAGEPHDPVLGTLALAWAASDLRSHLAGVRPATWAATLRLTASLADAESVAWRRHPECGCQG